MRHPINTILQKSPLQKKDFRLRREYFEERTNLLRDLPENQINVKVCVGGSLVSMRVSCHSNTKLIKKPQ